MTWRFRETAAAAATTWQASMGYGPLMRFVDIDEVLVAGGGVIDTFDSDLAQQLRLVPVLEEVAPGTAPRPLLPAVVRYPSLSLFPGG